MQVRTGMWRTRGGKTACVVAHAPWRHRDHRWLALFGESIHSYGDDGQYYWDRECSFDLVEFLSPEIADPRTWQPLELSEGIWERSDGSRGLLENDGSGDTCPWRYVEYKGGEVCYEYYNDHGVSSLGQPHLVRKLQDNPFRGPTKE